jgi:diaminopimelate epimerase
MDFAKYEGLGNDFVLFDGRTCPATWLTPSRVQALCDRHTGIGADGVLWVLPEAARSSARMVVHNADGSRAAMCGNGVRCVVAWMADRGWIATGATTTVESDAGPRAATLVGRGEPGVVVTVDMGVVSLTATVTVNASGRIEQVHLVDVGNPHAVVFREGALDEDLVRAVTALTAAGDGINVEIVRVVEQALEVRVHERGVGWTRACGTGACAVAAVAVARGVIPADQRVHVRLEGGVLTVQMDGDGRAWMTGPARRVFEGQLSAV